MTILTYEQLHILKKEIERLKTKGEILNPNNNFERRELYSIIKQLKELSSLKTERRVHHLKIVK
jgi:hypothetical protein